MFLHTQKTQYTGTLIIKVYFRINTKNQGVSMKLLSWEIIERELTLDAIYRDLKNVRKELLVH